MNEEDLEFSRAAVALLRGVVERRADEALYQTICAQEQALKEYFHRLGLLLTVDAADEYAYLRQDEASGVPRLMARTQLSYPLSLLLLLLRKRLGEYDALEGDSRLILSSAQMAEMLAPFFPQVTDRVRFLARVRQQAERAASLGFLHRLAGEDAYEVLPLLRSFVTGAWLEEFSERLAQYRAYGAAQQEIAAEPSEEVALPLASADEAPDETALPRTPAEERPEETAQPHVPEHTPEETTLPLMTAGKTRPRGLRVAEKEEDDDGLV